MPPGKWNSRSGKKFSLLPPMPNDARLSGRASDASRTSALAPAPEDSKLCPLPEALRALLGRGGFGGDTTQRQLQHPGDSLMPGNEDIGFLRRSNAFAGTSRATGDPTLGCTRAACSEQEQDSPAMARAKKSTARTDKMLTNFMLMRLPEAQYCCLRYLAMRSPPKFLPLCCLLGFHSAREIAI